MTVVTDTQAIVWYLSSPERLSQAAVDAFDSALDEGAPIAISTISLVENQHFVEKGPLRGALLERLDELLEASEPAIVPVPLDLAVARALREVPRG